MSSNLVIGRLSRRTLTCLSKGVGAGMEDLDIVIISREGC